jgi:hypothetical protein
MRPSTTPASTSSTLQAPPSVNQRLTAHAGQKTASEPTVPTVSRHDPPAERSAAHLAAVDARPRSGSGNWGPTKKIVLQTYPKQAGVNPVPMDWGNLDPQSRGPVVVSHSASTVKRRNGEVSGRFTILLMTVSNRRSWGQLLHLPCARGCKQKPGRGLSPNLHQCRAGRKHRTVPSVGRRREDRGHGSVGPCLALGVQELH